MPTKSKRLPKIHLDSCEQISAYADSLKKEQIKKLDLSHVSFTSMSAEQLSALGKMICDAEIESLILINNNIGKLSTDCLTSLFQGLDQAKLKKWRIDSNQLALPSFSEEHWRLLAATTSSLPSLECLSLQYNELANQNEAQFTQFKKLVKNSYKCLITYNNWSLKQWNQIINAENEHEAPLKLDQDKDPYPGSPTP